MEKTEKHHRKWRSRLTPDLHGLDFAVLCLHFECANIIFLWTREIEVVIGNF